MSHRSRIVPQSLLAFLLVTIPAFAVDGVILIDQNRAMAGSVTPGDSPGFPVTISTRGSYRLSGNLTVSDVDTTAIDVLSSAGSVTIDLNGFSIVGPVTCTIGSGGDPTTCSDSASDPGIFGHGTGIRSAATDSLTVKNGSILGMGRFALFAAGAPRVIIENLHAIENGLGGLWPSSAVIVNSSVVTNGGFGIQANQGVIKGTMVSRNAGTGIVSTGQPINIQDCFIHLNGGFGVDFAATGLIGASIVSSNLGGGLTGPFEESTNNRCSGTGCP